MLETQAQDMALLGLIIGPNQDPLAWNGSFNDSGWAWSANGTYNGAPLSLSYTGTYNPAGTVDPNSDVVSWTGAGTILGLGSMSFGGKATIVDDWSWTAFAILVFAAAADATIVGLEIATAAPAITGAASVKAITVITTAGISAAAAVSIAESTGVVPNMKKLLGSETITPSGTGSTVVAMVNGDAMNGVATGEITVAAVPEPSSLALLVSAGLGCFVYLRRRIR